DAFGALTGTVCRQLRDVADAAGSHVRVPLQGSGTFAVEAALGTLVPDEGRVLVPCNGAYAERIVRILYRIGRGATVMGFDELEPVDPARVEAALRDDPGLTHVALVHCETGTGILNPLDEVAEVCARRGRRLVVDAMSSFGALPVDARHPCVEAIVAASGKCLEGVPGMGFVLVRRDAIRAAEGRA
ncbi:MAG TPA: aminotransferase class V-fold PLP-dependent enzyme, partial [Burkholderiaceae bacterium]|nr:aminotransferase class V-fold PLP-dependent enzyme [Burkholderiaceae bacterium]